MKKVKKDNREGGPRIWEVLEEDYRRWVDEHRRDGDDLEGNGEKLQDKLEPPSGIVMSLLPFQKEWLSWALKQEASDVRGGILADEMGMVKTIQAISLVLAAPPSYPAPDVFSGPSTSSPALPKIKGTLVVCPLGAVNQWKNEIGMSTVEGSTKVLIYHGTKRGKAAKQFSAYDFVLTTYSIIQADYMKCNMPHKKRCEWCRKLLYPKKMDVYLKYFCGPNAVKTEKQSKQVRKKKQLEGNVDNLKKKSDDLGKDEEGDGISDPEGGNREEAVKGKKRGRTPKKARGSSDDNSTAEGDRLSTEISALHSVNWERIISDEAQDRIHQIGQYKPIRIVRFVIENTIEERILELQKKKKLLFEKTVERSSQTSGGLTEADLRSLFDRKK